VYPLGVRLIAPCRRFHYRDYRAARRLAKGVLDDLFQFIRFSEHVQVVRGCPNSGLKVGTQALAGRFRGRLQILKKR
jgi:hypothetical protein